MRQNCTMSIFQPAPAIPGGGLLPLTPAAPDGEFRLLFVHAHPDDETLATGATMAHYAAAGVRVGLLTCTRGELGEVIPPALAHLEVKPGGADDGGAGLAAVRSAELADALAALGVREHWFLGSPGALAAGAGPVAYRDSGMSWGADGRAQPAATVLPGSLSRAPLEEEAAHAAALIAGFAPDAVVTYAADGGYGHPDHVRTHLLTVRALDLAAAAGSGVQRAWAIVSDRPERPPATGTRPTAVAGPLAAKLAAMRAHKTQIDVRDNRYALSDGVEKDCSDREFFVPLERT
jgi:N-acetyl-1-D-myo-inositol-2-amino-2-deoxy-alpha-D-glucopyranoside deacetylase